jgi:hypothetical protein
MKKINQITTAATTSIQTMAKSGSTSLDALLQDAVASSGSNTSSASGTSGTSGTSSTADSGVSISSADTSSIQATAKSGSTSLDALLQDAVASSGSNTSNASGTSGTADSGVSTSSVSIPRDSVATYFWYRKF